MINHFTSNNPIVRVPNTNKVPLSSRVKIEPFKNIPLLRQHDFEPAEMKHMADEENPEIENYVAAANAHMGQIIDSPHVIHHESDAVAIKESKPNKKLNEDSEPLTKEGWKQENNKIGADISGPKLKKKIK